MSNYINSNRFESSLFSRRLFHLYTAAQNESQVNKNHQWHLAKPIFKNRTSPFDMKNTWVLFLYVFFFILRWLICSLKTIDQVAFRFWFRSRSFWYLIYVISLVVMYTNLCPRAVCAALISECVCVYCFVFIAKLIAQTPHNSTIPINSVLVRWIVEMLLFRWFFCLSIQMAYSTLNDHLNRFQFEHFAV